VTLFTRSARDNPQAERVEHNAVAAILDLPRVHRFFEVNEGTGRLMVSSNLSTASKEEVLQTCEQAYVLLPQDHTIITLAGIGFATVGEPGRALPLFEQAVRLRPKNADYRLNLARAALATGQFAKAREALDAAQALAPNNPTVLGVRLELEWRTGDMAAARETLLTLQKISPSEENARWLQEAEARLAKPAAP
jgi:Flp pilus assembly protein TadD